MAVRHRTVGGRALCNKVHRENIPREGKVRLPFVMTHFNSCALV